MGLKDFYYKLEDKYYAALDWLDEKGIKLYPVDDWLQKHNLPSFPIVVGTFLLIIILIVWLALWGFGVVGQNNINGVVQFVDKTNDSYARDIQVTLKMDGKTLNKTTDAEGKVYFVLAPNTVVEILLADADKYSIDPATVMFATDGEVKTVNLYDKTGAFLSRTFRLFEDVTSNALFMGDLDLEISCAYGADYEKSITARSGSFDLYDIPAECESIVVFAPSLGVTETISTTETSPTINLAGDVVKKGYITVSCIDNEGNALPNIVVSAINENNLKVADATTQSGGTAKLEVPVGKYFLIANDLSQVYSPLDSHETQNQNYFFEDVSENEEAFATLTFTKGNLGFIIVKATDPTGKAITGGQVTVYKGTSAWVSEGTLDNEGMFRYAVKELTSFRVVIDHPQYMVVEKSNLTASEMPYAITLSPVTTSPELYVKVFGTDNMPVANATVQLFKRAEGEAALLTKTTGANGVAEFRRLEAGYTYFAKVFKGEYSVTSSDIVLDARRTNELPVVLVIGNGDVSVLVLDESGNPAQGADVEFFNMEDDRKLGVTQTTDATGYASIQARGDNVVYAKVTQSGKGEFYTLAKPVQVGITTELQAYLVGTPSTLNVKFLGLYDVMGTKLEGTPLRVAAASDYKARFLLEVPEGAPYNDGEVFFRMDNVSDITQASLFVTNVSVLNGTTEKGTTYNAPNGYADDMANRTASKGLWAVAKLSKVKSGTHMVEIDFSTVAKPTKNTLSISYRTALRNGNTYSRSPLDEVLGQSYSTGDKHGFYANLDSENVLIGNAVCSNVFCAEFSMIDTLGNTSGVFNSYSAAKNGKYKFNIVNMFSVTNRTFTGARLEVYTETGAIEFSGVYFKVNGKLTASTGNAKKIVLPINEVNKSISIMGSFDMVPVKDGVLPLWFKVIDKDGTTLFEHKVEVSVDPANEMMVSLVPNVIVPFIDNAVLVVVTDETGEMPIDNAQVNAYSNEVAVASGKTSYEGSFGFELPEPNIGDVIKVVVDAAGYNPKTLAYTVSENILTIEPPEFSIIIDRSAQDFVEGALTLNNVTPLKLKMNNLKLAAGEYSDYVNVEFDRSFINKIIDSNIDVNYNAELTKLGESAFSPKSFDTKLLIDIEAREVGKTWSVELPAKVYIKLKGALDAADCLTLVPVTNSEELVWNAVLTNAGAKVTQAYNIVNACTYKELPVTLYNAEMSVVWQGKELGKFSIDNKQLSKTGVVLFEELAPGETPITVEFTGDQATIADQSKVVLTLKAIHPTGTTENSKQVLEAKANANVIVSDLARCIEVIGPNGNLNGYSVNNVPVVVIGVDTSGYGYGMWGNTFGSNPYGMLNANMGMGQPYMPMGGGYPTNYSDSYNYFFGTNGLLQTTGTDPMRSLYPNPSMFGTNPNAMYAQQMMSGANGMGGLNYNMGMNSGMMMPPIAKVELKNRCPYPVKMYVRSTPQLLIDATEVELAQNATKSVTVRSTIYPGTYAVSLLGAYNGLDTIPIVEIPVNVIDLESEAITNECFKLDNTSIDFSGFVEMIKEVKVYNQCYLKGVAFDSPAVAIQNLMVQTSDIKAKVPEANIAGGEQAYVTATAYEPNVSTHATYGKIQTVDVFLKKSLAVQRPERTGATKDNLGGLITKFSNTRVSSAQQYMSVNFPAVFIVNGLFGRGTNAMKKPVPIHVTIVDNWNYLGFGEILEDFLESGDPNCTPDKWKTHILTSKGKATLTNDNFKNGVAKVPKTGEYKILDTEACFGSFDSITFDDPQLCVNDSFKVYPRDGSDSVTFDVVAMKDVEPNPSGYPCKLEFEYVISSYHHPDAADRFARKTFVLNLTIKLDKKLSKASAGAQAGGQGQAGSLQDISGNATLTREQKQELANDVIKQNICDVALPGSTLLSSYLKENKLISFVYDDTISCDPFNKNGKLCDAQQFFNSIVNTKPSTGNKVPLPTAFDTWSYKPLEAPLTCEAVGNCSFLSAYGGTYKCDSSKPKEGCVLEGPSNLNVHPSNADCADEGYTYNATTGSCEFSCGTGFTLNTAKTACEVKDQYVCPQSCFGTSECKAETPEKGCVLNGKTIPQLITCPAGQELNNTGSCVNSITGNVECGAAFSFNAGENKCVFVRSYVIYPTECGDNTNPSEYGCLGATTCPANYKVVSKKANDGKTYKFCVINTINNSQIVCPSGYEFNNVLDCQVRAVSGGITCSGGLIKNADHCEYNGANVFTPMECTAGYTLTGKGSCKKDNVDAPTVPTTGLVTCPEAVDNFKCVNNALIHTCPENYELDAANARCVLIKSTGDYLTSGSALVELDIEYAFMYDDSVELQNAMKEVLTKPDVTEAQFRDVVKKMDAKLDSYEQGLSNQMDLMFVKDVTTDGKCPEGATRSNEKCYIKVSELTDLRLANWFAQDISVSKLPAYNAVYLFDASLKDAAKDTMVWYYIAKALSNKHEASDYGYFVANLKADKFSKAFSSWKNALMSNKTKLTCEYTDNVLISQNGTYLIKTTDVSICTKSGKKLGVEFNNTRFMSELVIDPYEQEGAKAFGYCSTRESYALKQKPFDATTVLKEHSTRGKNECDGAIFTAEIAKGRSNDATSDDLTRSGVRDIGTNVIATTDESYTFSIGRKVIMYPEFDYVVLASGKIDLEDLEIDAAAAWDSECKTAEVDTKTNGKVYVLYCKEDATIESKEGTLFINRMTRVTDEYEVLLDDQRSYGLHDIFTNPGNYCVRETAEDASFIYVPDVFKEGK